MLLILPRNLPICKLTVYKKCSSNKSRTTCTFLHREHTASNTIISTEVYMFSRLIFYVVLLKQGTKATTQTFPLNEQELIYIYLFCCHFFSGEREIHFQDCKHINFTSQGCFFFFPLIQSWTLKTFHKQGEARFSTFWCSALHFKAFVYTAINTYTLKRESKQTALQKNTSIN